MSSRTAAGDGLLLQAGFFVAVAVLTGMIALKILGPASPVHTGGHAALWGVLLGVVMPGLAIIGVAIWVGLSLNGGRR